MKKLILIRHGESEWNKLNLFTGWTNVDLSEKGVQEAIEAGKVLKENGYKKGTVEKLPDFSAQKPVTDAEKTIFNDACSSYQFPLGTPSTVGSRKTSDGMEYKFIVKSSGFGGGGGGESIIYVVVGKEAGAKPEFTQVVR